MKKLLPIVLASMLLGCGGSGSNSSTSETKSQSQRIIDDPALALQIAPLADLSPLKIPAPDSNGKILISVADLQSNYDTKFCQLNATVTLQAPQCQADITYISQQSGTGYFDLNQKPIQNNTVGVTGVLFQPITYNTTVPLPAGQQTFSVSGGLIMPQGIGKDKIKGVVTYFHATAFNNSKVGSDYATNGETQLVSEVFASQGYIVVIPDYVGQGVDWQNVHPYVLYPQVSDKTAVDMLNSVLPKIREQYGLTDSEQLKLFTGGYSEGGAYAVWLASYLQNNPNVLNPAYQFKHSVGMEGAYATSAVMKGFLFDNVNQGDGNQYNIQTQALTNVAKPVLSADTFLSYATYQLAGNMPSVFNMDFYNMNCSLPYAQVNCDFSYEGTVQHVNMSEAFAQSNSSAQVPAILYSALNKSLNNATYPLRTELPYSFKNSVNPLTSSEMFTSAGQSQLDSALLAAQVNLGALAGQPVSIVSLDLDSVVTPNNYSWLLATYPSKIRDHYLVSANSILVRDPGQNEYVPVDHLRGLIYEYLYALNIFNQF